MHYGLNKFTIKLRLIFFSTFVHRFVSNHSMGPSVVMRTKLFKKAYHAQTGGICINMRIVDSKIKHGFSMKTNKFAPILFESPGKFVAQDWIFCSYPCFETYEIIVI